ncbi:hypothetical protein PSACC_03496 [Paramicrosporidium saccamoebae]|uniref:Probable methionine--tRNA ligase, mitochondrial n=1 Tax=Paramicrosporidium saccamoebae TaxID=1246581 RepID=A0A2H9TG11_9FUNG|nr:hypothetical protein PSACC_03496 [Paramicrosporidium saccamoebae]
MQKTLGPWRALITRRALSNATIASNVTTLEFATPDFTTPNLTSLDSATPDLTSLDSTNTSKTPVTTTFHAVTTPIFYVNAAPHIGHAYSLILADAIRRWESVRNRDGAISQLYTGTDEHGQKVYEAAQRADMSPQTWCDNVSKTFREMLPLLGITATRFIRTTEPSHRRAVHELWRRLVQNGDIYAGVHSGWYCVSEETFYPEHKLVDTAAGKIVKTTGQRVEWVEERNYMFRLSAYRTRIIEWLKNAVVPHARTNDLHAFLTDEEFGDISVSRRKETVRWGIPVPDDDSQMVYVWLDALTNYLTCTGYPDVARTPNVHVVGKDIFK